MKIVVMGAGVVGVTTAYFLARNGHDVEVLDRQSAPAMETSFANAGQISPGYASPWAAPGIPLKAIKWLLMRDAPLIVRPTTDIAQYGWSLAMLANCTSGRYQVNKSRMVRLAEYSRDVLKQLRQETGISYDERERGLLQLLRTRKLLDNAGKDIKVLEDYGVPYELLDRSGCIAAEPGLANSSSEIAGGLRLPGDETGDCYKFTVALAGMAKELGVEFRFGVNIEDIEIEAGRVTGVRTNHGTYRGDGYVLALGSFSRKLASSIGERLPIYPVKGYSITAPIRDAAAAPVSTILDEANKIALTRLGNRVRVGGMAELSGYNVKLDERRRGTLSRTLEDLFPGAGDRESASFWTGMRPMTPDSVPIVGRGRFENFYINSGHGTLGWTMSCGSARIIADLVSGRTSDIDISDLGPERYA